MRKELAKNYDPKDIEEGLYSKWLEKKYFHAEVDETPVSTRLPRKTRRRFAPLHVSRLTDLATWRDS